MCGDGAGSVPDTGEMDWMRRTGWRVRRELAWEWADPMAADYLGGKSGRVPFCASGEVVFIGPLSTRSHHLRSEVDAARDWLVTQIAAYLESAVRRSRSRGLPPRKRDTRS